MKKQFLSLLTLCLMGVGSAFAQSEIVVGDMNDDGLLTVSDVTSLSETVVGKAPRRTISMKSDPNASDPSAIVGTWCAVDKSTLELTAEGKATMSGNSAVTQFEYFPFRGDLVLLNAESEVVIDFHVLRLLEDRIVFRLLDGSYLTYYYAIGNDHEYVDLGLTSGTLWATTNVGAENPEDYGDYFAWGETEPKSIYNWSTYFDSNDGINFAKYYGIGGMIELELDDDAAYKNWGTGWRMPSYAQLEELLTECNCTWTTQNGKNGYLVRSKVNGASIFLPAAGDYSGDSFKLVGSNGFYWSRSLNTSKPSSAWDLIFYSGFVGSSYNNRYVGFPVRPVRVSSQN